MTFQKLNRTKRDREYNHYSSIIKADVVYLYLFKGLSHRSLDKTVIGLDPDISKGYQSMNILHFIGLRNHHKSCFENINVDDAIEVLRQIETRDALIIVKHLEDYKEKNKEVIDGEKFERDFQKQIEESKSCTLVERNKRLELDNNRKPKLIEVISKVFRRNPDVVAEVLERSNGLCEYCQQKAPFLKAKDGEPYLEVHHILRLADGGDDTVDNAVALCPNCHRKAHFGIK